MYNNRLLQVVSVVVMLMAVAASGVAAASAPTGPERNAASSPCLAIIQQELGTVMPSAWSGYQESDCSLTGGRSAGLATLDNPNHKWIGPETVSAALGQPSSFVPMTSGSGDLTSTAPDLFGSQAYYDQEAALAQQSSSFPTTGGSRDLTPATDGVLDPTRGY